MGSQWSFFGFPHPRVLFVVLMFHLNINTCCSLNLEGLALLAIRARMDSDSYGAISDWNPNDDSPCMWSGVFCHNDEVHMLELSEMNLGGVLAPEIGKLSNMRALVLYKNNFSGAIPREIAELKKLEFLDLRHNKLSGHVRTEIRTMQSLKHLFLCNNNLEGVISLDSQFFLTLQSFTSPKPDWMSSKIRMRLAKRSFAGSGTEEKPLHFPRDSEPCEIQGVEHLFAIRRKLLDLATNLPAAHISGAQLSPGGASSLSSGSVPAKIISSSPSSSLASPTAPPSNTETVTHGRMTRTWVYTVVIPAAVVILLLYIVSLLMCRSRSAAAIRPWKSRLSGQLQKAFVTGAPKLNRAELETACEDFNNIIGNLPDCTVFKGTLSSGVEIAVTSTTVTSIEDWSRSSELYFRKKLDMLSRLNHKNFANLLGYCVEDGPFTRMMVFEYASNGTLFEHLHVGEVEHLDWGARMRIIMGLAYCLQYMHNEMNPPVAHPNLQSSSIYLMDDFAAKLADFTYWKGSGERIRPGDDADDHVDRFNQLYADLDGNIYKFGILLLEIISGKLPYSEEQGYLINWAVDYLNDKRSISYMIDPTLKSFKNNELDVICEVIQQCIHPDTKQRPTMKDVAAKLREVLGISPESAYPRLSPLWWAELEILSVEAS